MSTLAIYERLQAKGIIGPRDEHGNPRPYQEFPKQVRDAEGKLHIVRSAREELTIAATTPNASPADDPIIIGQNRLLQENVELRARLELLSMQSVGGSPETVKSAHLQEQHSAPAQLGLPLVSPKAPAPQHSESPAPIVDTSLPAGAKLGTPQRKGL